MDIVNNFIDASYTAELASELYRAIGLMNVFGQNDVIMSLQEIVMTEQEQHREVIIDRVVETIDRGLDRLFMAQRIKLIDETPLQFKNEILQALFSFNYREDYLPYIRVLENPQLSAEEKLCEILEDLTGISQDEFNVYIDEVFDGSIARMKEYAQGGLTEEQESEDLDLLREIRKSLRAYQEAFGLPAAVARLSEFDIAKGLKFDTYFQLFESEVFDLNDLESTVFNLLYLALISEEGHMNPQKFLMEQTDHLFNNIQDAQNFLRMLQKAMGRLEDIKAHSK